MTIVFLTIYFLMALYAILRFLRYFQTFLHLFMDYTTNHIIDDYAEKTVRIVEEGNLPTEYGLPQTSEQKFELACSILTDSLANIGFDTNKIHIPAIITAKVNQLYHSEIPRRFQLGKDRRN